MKAIIIGGGIGGLATALSLHEQGIEAHVYEQSQAIKELGVGINTLPHAIRELAALGLLDALDAVGIRTYELIYQNRFGQEIWRDLRGTDAGYDYPQFSIHRGKLQGVLLAAVRERLGEDRVHTGHQLIDFEDDGNQVTARFDRRDTSTTVSVTGDVMIGCDGIHSKVRQAFYPDEGPPRWNGLMLWRGAVEGEPFLTGRSMVIAGGMSAKFVCYPIYNDPDTPGKTLINWAVLARVGESDSAPPRRESWNQLGERADVMQYVDRFELDLIDPVDLITKTVDFYEFPMCDRDPVEHWSFGRVTLLGDAAHPMYPVGSNGASQAILDARCLAPLLATCGGDVEGALKKYEQERLPVTAEIVRTNRSGGPEGVIDLVEGRAPDGFETLEDVATREELESIVKGYATLAKFSQDDVNRASG